MSIRATARHGGKSLDNRRLRTCFIHQYLPFPGTARSTVKSGPPEILMIALNYSCISAIFSAGIDISIDFSDIVTPEDDAAVLRWFFGDFMNFICNQVFAYWQLTELVQVSGDFRCERKLKKIKDFQR